MSETRKLTVVVMGMPTDLEVVPDAPLSFLADRARHETQHVDLKNGWEIREPDGTLLDPTQPVSVVEGTLLYMNPRAGVGGAMPREAVKRLRGLIKTLRTISGNHPASEVVAVTVSAGAWGEIALELEAALSAARPAEPTGSWSGSVAEKWPEGVSDGLTLACGRCGVVPPFDYGVTDEAWAAAGVPDEHRLGVICLPCLDALATARGVDISDAIEEVQFTGIGKTVVLRPVLVHRYEARPVGEPTAAHPTGGHADA